MSKEIISRRDFLKRTKKVALGTILAVAFGGRAEAQEPVLEEPALNEVVVYPDGLGGECPAIEYGQILSPEKDWRRVVIDEKGERIWNDSLPNGDERPAWETSFTGQWTGKSTLNAVNAEVLQDVNKDGLEMVKIGGGANNEIIDLVAGGWYKVINGNFNGGFEILKPEQPTQ